MKTAAEVLHAAIRRVIPLCESPFDGRAVLAKLTGHQVDARTVQNVLLGLTERGELARSYVKRYRRKNAAVFATTPKFGEHRSSPEALGEAMQRLDAALRNWKRPQPKEARP
jgi:hypothetical protein